MSWGIILAIAGAAVVILLVVFVVFGVRGGAGPGAGAARQSQLPRLPRGSRRPRPPKERWEQQQQQMRREQQQQQQQPIPWEEFAREPAEAASPIPEGVVTGVVEGVTSEPETVPRYVDPTMFEQKDHIRGARLEPTAWLEVGEWYELEIAVRVEREGFTAGQDQAPIFDPHQEAILLIALEPFDENDLVIVEQVKSLKLPATGDSVDNAVFELSPKRESTEKAPIKCRLRVYYRLNLVEVGNIEMHIRPRFAPAKASADPLRYEQERLVQSYLDLDKTEPRQLSIDITHDQIGFGLSFLFDGNKHFFARATVGTGDIDDLLVKTRSALESIATSDKFQKKVSADNWDFQADVRMLAEHGTRLWTRLFKQHPDSSIFAIGEALQQNPLAQGSLVKITIGPGADEFIYSWSILYDRPLPKDGQPVDADGFWGMRYRIEQWLPYVRARSDVLVPTKSAITLDFVLNQTFDNWNLQVALLKGFAAGSGGALRVSTPPFDEADTYKPWLVSGAAEILYFYCHGYSRLPQQSAVANAVAASLRDLYRQLGPKHSLKKRLALVAAAAGIGKDSDRSWIEPTYKRLYLDELMGLSPALALTKHPIVILNLCESAELFPTLSESFVDFFLSHGASTVLGTECAMTTAFAHPFAEQVLSGVLGARNVGEVVLDARRHFMKLQNPLGLAYSVYGSALTRLESAVVPLPAESN